MLGACCRDSRSVGVFGDWIAVALEGPEARSFFVRAGGIFYVSPRIMDFVILGSLEAAPKNESGEGVGEARSKQTMTPQVWLVRWSFGRATIIAWSPIDHRNHIFCLDDPISAINRPFFDDEDTSN